MGILRGVSGKVLECGCLVGVYETYGGQVLVEVDAVQPRCTDHHKGERVPADVLRMSSPTPARPVSRVS